MLAAVGSDNGKEKEHRKGRYMDFSSKRAFESRLHQGIKTQKKRTVSKSVRKSTDESAGLWSEGSMNWRKKFPMSFTDGCAGMRR